MLLCGLLGKLLFTFPEKDWLAALAAESVFAEAPFAAKQPDVKAGLELLNAWADLNHEGLSDHNFDDVVADYTRLFIGPGSVLAPPWESVFVEKGRMIFQKATLDVRDWYRRHGLQSVKLYQEPDDHIGLELRFLAHLAGEGLSALEQGDDVAFEAANDAQRRFLSGHVLNWAPVWCDQVMVYTRTDFYRGVALSVKGLLQELADLFELELVEREL
jgi:TorA maturation chaperone TorD